MTEREKLIELLKTPNKGEQLMQMGVDIGAYQDDCIEAMIADYLLANGVIVPPCKVGDTVVCAMAICLSTRYCNGRGARNPTLRYQPKPLYVLH